MERDQADAFLGEHAGDVSELGGRLVDVGEIAKGLFPDVGGWV